MFSCCYFQMQILIRLSKRMASFGKKEIEQTSHGPSVTVSIRPIFGISLQLLLNPFRSQPYDFAFLLTTADTGTSLVVLPFDEPEIGNYEPISCSRNQDVSRTKIAMNQFVWVYECETFGQIKDAVIMGRNWTVVPIINPCLKVRCTELESNISLKSKW